MRKAVGGLHAETKNNLNHLMLRLQPRRNTARAGRLQLT